MWKWLKKFITDAKFTWKDFILMLAIGFTLMAVTTITMDVINK